MCISLLFTRLSIVERKLDVAVKPSKSRQSSQCQTIDRKGDVFHE